MAIPRLDLTVRNLQRYRQILNTFLRYGFAHLIERMDLSRVLGSRIRRKSSQPLDDLGFAVRVRMAFEELGPTFVKIGQMISTQAVGLPDDLLLELSRLQDEAGRVDPAVIRRFVSGGARIA